MNFTNISVLLVISFATLCVAKRSINQVNPEERKVILVVQGRENLRKLTNQLFALQNTRSTYHNSINAKDHEVIEKAIQQGPAYNVPQNSYALILTTKDEVSTDAIMTFLSRFTSVRNVNVIIEARGRRQRSAALVSVGTNLVSTIRNGVRDNVKEDDVYAKKVLDALSKGLGVFSFGMAACSLVPNPVTGPVAVATSALSLGLSIARDLI